MRLSFRSNSLRGAILALALTVPAVAMPMPLKIPPIDQCKGDASFVAFRADLKKIVARRDRAAFLALLAPDVLVDFGGGTGPKVFEEQWQFDPNEYGNLWDQLETMLKLGCAQSDAERVIPSLIMQIELDPDELTEPVLILPGASLYEGAGKKSPRPATDPWTVATVISRNSDTMTGVRLPDGREGYIPDDLVYEPTDFRMIMSRRGGKWVITAFVAGD